MVSQAEREQARRYIIEKAYVGPPALEGWHVARDDERPGVIPERIIKAATALGWTVTEMACTDWHLPKWETVEGREAVYVAKPRRQYHLLVAWPGDSKKALKKAAKATSKPLGGLTMIYVDGVKFSAHVGLAGETTWQVCDTPANSLAKLLTTNGVPR